MGAIRLIVVVTLGSTTCDRAVDAAARRAAEGDRPLRLLYVADTSFLGDMSREISGLDEMARHFEVIGKLILRRQEKLARVHTGNVETEVLHGRAVSVLSEFVKRVRASELHIGKDALHVLEKGSRRTLAEALAPAAVPLLVAK